MRNFKITDRYSLNNHDLNLIQAYILILLSILDINV